MSKLVFVDYINMVIYAITPAYKIHKHNEYLYQRTGESFVINIHDVFL